MRADEGADGSAVVTHRGGQARALHDGDRCSADLPLIDDAVTVEQLLAPLGHATTSTRRTSKS
jgi:hypothetical protein